MPFLKKIQYLSGDAWSNYFRVSQGCNIGLQCNHQAISFVKVSETIIDFVPHFWKHLDRKLALLISLLMQRSSCYGSRRIKDGAGVRVVGKNSFFQRCFINKCRFSQILHSAEVLLYSQFRQSNKALAKIGQNK